MFVDYVFRIDGQALLHVGRTLMVAKAWHVFISYGFLVLVVFASLSVVSQF